MQFITSGDRIATENFTLGRIYTVTFNNGNYFINTCIGIGPDYVMFQQTAPKMLFKLDMETAANVDTIDESSSGAGTMNYNELENKPQIEGVTLQGNKSLSDLGIASASDLAAKQDVIYDLDTIRSGAAAGATAVQPAALEAYQPLINDLDTIRSGAAAGATAVQPETLSGYQTLIDSSHKLSSDLVDDTGHDNKFATAAQLAQIESNKNNISSKCVYCTCNTASSTAAKVVNAPNGFVLQSGCIIGVLFSNNNSATNVTLNVGGTGAISIAYGSSRPYTGTFSKITGNKDVVNCYMYDGSYWVFLTNSTAYSNMSQSEASAGSSTTDRLITAKVLSDTIDEKLVPVENNILIEDVTSHFSAKTGYTIQSSYTKIYKQGTHIFGKMVVGKDSGTFDNNTQEQVVETDYKMISQYFSCAFADTLFRCNNIGYCFAGIVADKGVFTVRDTVVNANNYVVLSIDYIAQ